MRTHTKPQQEPGSKCMSHSQLSKYTLSRVTLVLHAVLARVKPLPKNPQADLATKFAIRGSINKNKLKFFSDRVYNIRKLITDILVKYVVRRRTFT